MLLDTFGAECAMECAMKKANVRRNLKVGKTPRLRGKSGKSRLTIKQRATERLVELRSSSQDVRSVS